jgi:hypothetical protein
MKRLLWAIALLPLLATSALAAGADLSVFACPGDAAASASAGSLDCAGGSSVTLLLTFMPAEAVSDLVALDVIFDLVVDGDVTTNATFWDFQSANTAAITSRHQRPAVGCADYTDVWNRSGSGSAWAAALRSPSNVRVATVSYRLTDYAALANQRLFGVQLVLDTHQAIEAGGAATGCTRGVCMVLQQAIPGSAIGSPTTVLTAPSVFGNEVTFNGGSTTMCFSVPTVRHTWGQLKSLYR